MKSEHNVCRVGISGSYGGMNLGDEAILQVVVEELRRRLPVEVTVFSLNSEDTLTRQDVERAVPVRDLSRAEVAEEIKRLHFFVLGGGSSTMARRATSCAKHRSRKSWTCRS